MTVNENYYLEEFKKEVRELIANYMRSEGCTCCQDLEEHTDVKRRLGELLDCGKYNDEDEYNFYQYVTKKGIVTELTKNVVGQSEQLHSEVFNLANKLALNGHGDLAVRMHMIANDM